MKTHREKNDSPPSFDRRRIALVEDDPDFRTLVRGGVDGFALCAAVRARPGFAGGIGTDEDLLAAGL